MEEFNSLERMLFFLVSIPPLYEILNLSLILYNWKKERYKETLMITSIQTGQRNQDILILLIDIFNFVKIKIYWQLTFFWNIFSSPSFLRFIFFFYLFFKYLSKRETQKLREIRFFLNFPFLLTFFNEKRKDFQY